MDRFKQFGNDHSNWIISALIVTALVPFVQTAVSELGEKARREAVDNPVRNDPGLLMPGFFSSKERTPCRKR